MHCWQVNVQGMTTKSQTVAEVRAMWREAKRREGTAFYLTRSKALDVTARCGTVRWFMAATQHLHSCVAKSDRFEGAIDNR